MKLTALKSEEVNFDQPLCIEEFDKFTMELRNLATKTQDPNVQASVCRRLIKKVEVSTTGIRIHYHVGDHHYEKEFSDTRNGLGRLKSDVKSRFRGSMGKPAGPLFISRPLEKYRNRKGSGKGTICQTVDGSNSLINGRGSRT